MERARLHANLVYDRLPHQKVDTEERVGGEKGGASSGGGEEGELVAEGIRSLIRATWEDVKGWCDEEAEARVRRKDSQVRKIGQGILCTSSSVDSRCRYGLLYLRHGYGQTWVCVVCIFFFVCARSCVWWAA